MHDFTQTEFLLILAVSLAILGGGRQKFVEGHPRAYTAEDLASLRSRTKSVFDSAYNAYLQHAYPFDELKPLSCSGMDTWGSYSLTLIDALDTLVVVGNLTEFRRVYSLISDRINFNTDINVSVFETNIRIIGGLLSGHLFAKKAGVSVSKSWPCVGPLLDMAVDVANRLLPAFDTPTAMPYGSINLKKGVLSNESNVTCTATIGSMLVEFGTLSRLTGNPIYETTVLRAMEALFMRRSSLDLVGNHINVINGKWTAMEAGIGGGIDSYYEYLVKAAVLLDRPLLKQEFDLLHTAVRKHMLKSIKRSKSYERSTIWYNWVSMTDGTSSVFGASAAQSLEMFWPGLMSMLNELPEAGQAMHNYHEVWRRYGFVPESFDTVSRQPNRPVYPLRPELAESAMYLFRSTGDWKYVSVAEDILTSIEVATRTGCGGFATVEDVKTHRLGDRMESFFLAETVKYLYLTFDVDNFVHRSDSMVKHQTEDGPVCYMESGLYVFNTEAHVIDVGALECCTSAIHLPSVRSSRAENVGSAIDMDDFSRADYKSMASLYNVRDKKRSSEVITTAEALSPSQNRSSLNESSVDDPVSSLVAAVSKVVTKVLDKIFTPKPVAKSFNLAKFVKQLKLWERAKPMHYQVTSSDSMSCPTIEFGQLFACDDQL